MAFKTFGWRHVQALLSLAVVTLAFILRINMSVAIVAMTDTKTSTDLPKLDWDYRQRGMILSAFFWGYMMLQIVAGTTAQKFGASHQLLVAIILCSFFTIVIPPLSHYGYIIVCGLRFLQGLFQGIIYPSITVLLSKWAPADEKGRIFTLAFSGTNIGSLVGFPLAGFLASTAGGWPNVFYVTGGLGILWCLVFFFLGANSPASHSRITPEEKNFIEASLHTTSETRPPKKTPWGKIATSLPMWALLSAHLGQNWGYWTLGTQTPSYLSSVLHVDIQNNALLSSLQYLAGWISSIIFAWIADMVNKRKLISRTVHRKIWNSISAWGGALSLFILGLSESEDATFIIIMLITTVALDSGTYTGYLTNHVDLSPNFCGTLMGITNSLATTASISAPLCAGWLLSLADVDVPPGAIPASTNDTISVIISESERKSHLKRRWSQVFFISSAVFFTGNLIYVLFGSSEVQSWDNPAPDNTQENSDEPSSANHRIS